jgi:SAM-dependent methyltransferase
MDPAELQAAYYAETSGDYDRVHIDEPEHRIALDYISALIRQFKWETILDVGAGTGRAIDRLAHEHPHLTLNGIEPVAELIAAAERKDNIQPGQIQQGIGEELPFPSASFDAVVEIGVLHHVRNPAAVISEMTRVADKAVFLSDVNRFGTKDGPIKLAFWKLGLWGAVDRLKTRGRGYRISEGDGISYSYSVYDSYKQIAEWADRVFIIPTVPANSKTWLHPLLSANHALLVAVRD